MSSSTPHHRHQASLEGFIDLSLQPPLRPDQRRNAVQRFRRIVGHFEVPGSSTTSSSVGTTARYNQPLLIRLTYEYALSDESRDIFLRAFFTSMALSLDEGDDEEPDYEELRPLLSGFAEYLMDNFFLPLKATTNKTPQPSPAFHSAVQGAQGGSAQAFVGTHDRLSSLRGACLVRDRYRCVISNKFSEEELLRRYEKHGDDARDDDGVRLADEDPAQFDLLEVAHILPHSLTKTNTNAELDKPREAALAILNMFDCSVAHMIEGPDIDRPRNAITLSHRLHQHFGAFKLFFEPVPDRYNTYRIQKLLPAIALRDMDFPIVRTLSVTDTRTIDPPSPRLLAVHRAIALILHMSGAGEYIDALFRDVEEHGVRADGSTDLGRMVGLSLGGWLDSAVSS